MTRNDQEAFWEGSFGDEYVRRSSGEALVAANTALFARALARARDMDSVLELGANIGLNLVALRRLLPRLELSAVEINAQAVEELRRVEGCRIYHRSIFDFEPESRSDLVLTKGVLIHLAPERLEEVYRTISSAARRFVLMVEYYNPIPVEVEYRGHSRRLFKRDFAGEFLDLHGDFQLLDYGFIYHRDPMFPQDDLTWFLMERTGG